MALTVGKRIGIGFVIVLSIMIVVGVITYWGITRMAASSNDAAAKEKLAAALLQRQIDLA